MHIYMILFFAFKTWFFLHDSLTEIHRLKLGHLASSISSPYHQYSNTYSCISFTCVFCDRKWNIILYRLYVKVSQNQIRRTNIFQEQNHYNKIILISKISKSAAMGRSRRPFIEKTRLIMHWNADTSYKSRKKSSVSPQLISF